MDVETLTRELNEIRQLLKEKEAELEMKTVAMMQQMEENQTQTTQIERIEQESTAKIEVSVIIFQFSVQIVVYAISFSGINSVHYSHICNTYEKFCCTEINAACLFILVIVQPDVSDRILNTWIQLVMLRCHFV